MIEFWNCKCLMLLMLAGPTANATSSTTRSEGLETRATFTIAAGRRDRASTCVPIAKTQAPEAAALSR